MQQWPRSTARTLARASPVAADALERALDAALEATFPASDPIAVFLGDSLPAPADPRATKPRPAPGRDR
jgi:hypothetical protein